LILQEGGQVQAEHEHLALGENPSFWNQLLRVLWSNEIDPTDGRAGAVRVVLKIGAGD
jgi:hypothetical protein